MLPVIGAITSLALAIVGPAWAGDKDRGPGRANAQSADHQSHGNEPQAPSSAKHHSDHGKAAPVPAADVSAARVDPAPRGREAAAQQARRHARKGDPTPAAVRSEAPPIRWTNDPAQRFAAIGACPPGLARKNAACFPPGLEKQTGDGWGHAFSAGDFGIPLRGDATYVYYKGYLIPAGGKAAYIPLLGGALAVGQLWPDHYPVVPIPDWLGRYYGFDDPSQYRSTDNVIYRVDPQTSAIQSVVALLTGTDFTVGSPLPSGYDVYNVPSPYQSRFRDSDEALYRYADGRIYVVDPATMLIAEAIDLVL